MLDLLIQSELFGMERGLLVYCLESLRKAQEILQQYVIHVKCQAKFHLTIFFVIYGQL